jgi:hypothetical protein
MSMDLYSKRRWALVEIPLTVVAALAVQVESAMAVMFVHAAAPAAQV